jgi:putative ABC transport system permease protein
MLRNDFLSALRNMIRNKVHTLIQVLSLSVGITAVILIGLYATHEFTYDRYNEKMARMVSIFAAVAMLIACLGLFGLSSFMAARRTKEIGIRKSMGASVRSVFLLLSREFIIWVGLAIIIACPLGWIVMHRWLESFAYRTSFSWWIFLAAILVSIVITFATVTWQSLKTARTNPVESLRYE